MVQFHAFLYFLGSDQRSEVLRLPDQAGSGEFDDAAWNSEDDDDEEAVDGKEDGDEEQLMKEMDENDSEDEADEDEKFALQMANLQNSSVAVSAISKVSNTASSGKTSNKAAEAVTANKTATVTKREMKINWKEQPYVEVVEHFAAKERIDKLVYVHTCSCLSNVLFH